MLRELAPFVWRFEPPQSPGRKIGIVAGLHGDEIAPVDLLRQLCTQDHAIWENCGHQVTLVLAHPEAIALGERSVPGGADFNRSFGDIRAPLASEASRIELIKEHLRETEVLLDLHQTRLPIAPCAVCPGTSEHLALARQLGAHQAVTGAQATFMGGMLIDWANRNGTLALTLEVGSIGSPDATDVALSAIQSMLAPPREHKAPIVVWQLVDPLRALHEHYAWTECWENGSPISAGDLIATSPAGALHATVDGALFLPRLGASPGEICALQAVRIDP